MDRDSEQKPKWDIVEDDAKERDPIFGAAGRRHEILEKISATQHAKSALFQTRADLRTIYDKQSQLSALVKSTTEATQREKKEWMSAKGSKLKRLFHRGQYDEKVKKEEDEYYEAYEWQLRAEASTVAVSKQIDELTKKKSLLIKQVEEHRVAEAQLLDLYEEVFDGPTPRHPEEDKLEAEFNALLETFDSVQAKITHTSHVCDALRPASASLIGALRTAQNSFDTTLSNVGNMTLNLVGDVLQPDSRLPLSGNAKPKTYYAQGGTLEQIRVALASADKHMAAAQELDPSVMVHLLPQIDPENKAKRTGSLSRLFNAPLTDIIFYREIDEVGAALETTAKVVARELDIWETNLATLEGGRAPIESKMRACREKLFELRARVFDRVIRPPPEYEREKV